MRLYDNQPGGTVSRARDLRRDATDAEKRLRRALKVAFPKMKWRFQTPIGPYYADFLCFAQKLIVEVDGGQHDEQRAYDTRRTRFMEAEGYTVSRFWNNDVLGNTDGVIESIQNSLSRWEREGARPAKPGGKGERDQRDTKKKGEPVSANSPSPSHAAHGPLLLPKGEGK